MLPSEMFSQKEVDEAEKFMRHNVLGKENRQTMLHNLYITRESRRKLINEGSKKGNTSITPVFVLNKYPLFLRLNDAVSHVSYISSKY